MALSDRIASWFRGTPAPGVRLPSGMTVKATYGDNWLAALQSDIPLSVYNQDQQAKAARLLRAYKVGWFNKAERKISTDFAGLEVSLAPENDQGDNQSDIVEPDLLTPWDQLDPIGRFLRLMEKPNEQQSGRQLRQQTMIRLDMAGWTWWYTELGSDGMPVENGLYGISPSRLWPSKDDTGKLIGYVLDKDRAGGGVAFDVEEIIPFSYASADEEPTSGIGVVEPVWAQVPLTDQLAKHTSDVLSLGGRLAGAMWPKNRALDEGEFEDAKRTWRTLASDPNAARRMLLFPEPMEWVQGSATPEQLGIPELAALNRDDILTSFPIAPEMLGVPMPSGLNASGAARKEIRNEYWEGTIHPRVELFEEVIQTYLVPKYEAAVGYTLDFEVDEPNLDDPPEIIEKVSALDALTSAGFDEQEAIDAAGLGHIKFVGKPEPIPPPTLQVTESPRNDIRQGTTVPVEPQAAPPSRTPQTPQGKAMKAAEEQAQAVLDPATVRAKDRLERFFRSQRERVEKGWRNLPASKAARKAADDPTWWDSEYEDQELTDTMRGIYLDVGQGGLQTVANTLNRFIRKGFTANVLNDLLEYGGQRIKDINERTLEALTIELAEGTRRGYSINQLIEGVPDENYGGLLGVTLDNGTPAFDEYRAEMIARTETMLSYNRATIDGYGQFGVEYLEAYDGDQDAECADRLANNPYTIEEALAQEDHPNGTLVWSPIVDKAMHDERIERLLEEVVALKGLMIRPAEQPGPVFNLTVPPSEVRIEPTFTVEAAHVPEINIPATVVNLPPMDPTIVVDLSDVEPANVTVNVPEQVPPTIQVNVPKAELKATVKAEMPSEMRITSMPDRVTQRRVTRNDKGQIIETADVETDG